MQSSFLLRQRWAAMRFLLRLRMSWINSSCSEVSLCIFTIIWKSLRGRFVIWSTGNGSLTCEDIHEQSVILWPFLPESISTSELNWIDSWWQNKGTRHSIHHTRCFTMPFVKIKKIPSRKMICELWWNTNVTECIAMYFITTRWRQNTVLQMYKEHFSWVLTSQAYNIYQHHLLTKRSKEQETRARTKAENEEWERQE